MITSVSVIIPFYGTTHSKRLNLVVQSILSQAAVDVELVIAGLRTSTKVKEISDLIKHPKEESPEIVKTGAVINNGLGLSNGEFVYISDADIIFPSESYLECLVQEHSVTQTPLKRPPMRRLLLQDFDWFYSAVCSGGLWNATRSLDKSQKYIVKPSGVERPMRIFPKFENGKNKIFIASEDDFQEYISNKKNKGQEPRYFNQDRHCGAVFAQKDDFINVGGYHEEFISWGVWDADIQWKLESSLGMRLISYEEDFTVIHLDHLRGYFSKQKWEYDKELQKRRRTRGVEECMLEDRQVYSGGKNER